MMVIKEKNFDLIQKTQTKTNKQTQLLHPRPSIHFYIH